MSALPPPEGPSSTPPEFKPFASLSAEKLVPPGLKTAEFTLYFTSLAAIKSHADRLPIAKINEILNAIPAGLIETPALVFFLATLGLGLLRVVGALSEMTDQDAETPNSLRPIEIKPDITKFRESLNLSKGLYASYQEKLNPFLPRHLWPHVDNLMQLALSCDHDHQTKLVQAKVGRIEQEDTVNVRGWITANFLMQIGVYPAALTIIACTNPAISEPFLLKQEEAGIRADHDPLQLVIESFMHYHPDIRTILLARVADLESTLNSNTLPLVGTTYRFLHASLAAINSPQFVRNMEERGMTPSDITFFREQVAEILSDNGMMGEEQS